MTLWDSVRIVLMPRPYCSWSCSFAAIAVYNTLVPSFLFLFCQISYGTLTGFSWKMAIDKAEKVMFPWQQQHSREHTAKSCTQLMLPYHLEHPQYLCPKKRILWAFLQSIPARMAAWSEGLWEGVGRECLKVPCLDHPNKFHGLWLCILMSPSLGKAGNREIKIGQQGKKIKERTVQKKLGSEENQLSLLSSRSWCTGIMSQLGTGRMMGFESRLFCLCQQAASLFVKGTSWTEE